MYDLDIKEEADKKFKKLGKKQKKQLLIIRKKLQEIQNNPYHTYKFLRFPLQTYNRVHIDKHFVLMFRVNHEKKTIEVYEYGHHDHIYKWRPR